MKNRVVVALAVLVVLSGCARNSAAKRDRERQDVLQVYSQLKDGWAKGDLAVLDKVFRPDAIFINAQSNGAAEHWGSVRLSVQRSAEVLHPKLTDAGQPVVNVGDDTAWMATKYHVSATTPQGPMEADGILTLAFARTDGAWRVVLFHASRVP